VLVGERIEQNIPEEAVDDGDGADADREGQDGDAGEPRRPAQHAQRVADVPSRVLDPAERSRRALDLFGLLDAAERPSRRDARVRRAQAAALELLFKQRQVRGDFPVEVGVGATVMESWESRAKNRLTEDMLFTARRGGVCRRNWRVDASARSVCRAPACPIW
jgi:hypothetical protein